MACTLIGLWLGMARLKIADGGRNTACTALYRFGGGLGVAAVRRALGDVPFLTSADWWPVGREKVLPFSSYLGVFGARAVAAFFGV